MLERLYFSAGLEMSWCPPGGVDGNGQGEECLDLPAQTVAPTTRTRISDTKQNETQCRQGDNLCVPAKTTLNKGIREKKILAGIV